MERMYHYSERKEEGPADTQRLEEIYKGKVKELKEERKEATTVMQSLEAFERVMKGIMEEMKRKVLKALDTIAGMDETLIALKKEIEREKQDWMRVREGGKMEMDERTDRLKELKR